MHLTRKHSQAPSRNGVQASSGIPDGAITGMAGIATTIGADMDRTPATTTTVSMAVLVTTVGMAVPVITVLVITGPVVPVGQVVLAIMAAVTTDRES